MQISSWQTELRNSIKEPADLLQQLALSPASISLAKQSLQTFPLRAPMGFVGRIRKKDLSDPLLRQILPLFEEDSVNPDFTTDPIAELDKLKTPGVLHKYHGRILLVTTGVCAIHCRYCFRRYFPYAEENASHKNWQSALKYIDEDGSITEVILSGGDPLALSDKKLSDLVSQLEKIPHLKRLRIHTRMPIVIPQRVTDTLLNWLTQTSLKPIVIVHSNHPNEIDNQVEAGLKQMQQAGIQLMNQSVLLKNINDNNAVLAELSERLFDCGVLPYYLHMLDPVAGAAHFDVTMDVARKIMEELRKYLPGYLVPKLVREEPGAPFKIPLL